MEIKHDGSKLVIDGIVDVTKDGNDYTFQCGYHKITVAEPGTSWHHDTPPEQPAPKKDPHYYQNGNNGLSVADSVERAHETIVFNTWGGYHITNDEEELLRDSITNLIEEGAGRDKAYAIAGVVKKGAKEGRFKGASLAFFFHGIVEGYIKEPVKVEANKPILSPYFIR